VQLLAVCSAGEQGVEGEFLLAERTAANAGIKEALGIE
jgi:hypothetical protein